MGKVIRYREDRFKGYPYTLDQARELIYKTGNFNCDIRSLILDHIFLYCISENSFLYNLQLLKPRQSRLKTVIERRILKKLKEEGLIETITHYSLELMAPQEEVMKRFIELWKEYEKEYQEINFKTCVDVGIVIKQS